MQIVDGGSDAPIDPAVSEALAGGRAREAEIEIIADATPHGLDGRVGGERDGLSRFGPGWFDRIVDRADARLRWTPRARRPPAFGLVWRFGDSPHP